MQRSLSGLLGAIALMGALLSCGNLAQRGEAEGLRDFPRGDITPISQLQQPRSTPATVHLRGQVMEVAPLLQGGAYRLQDTSGSIWVLTSTPLPPVGDTLQIQGEVRYQTITIAGQELGESYIQETERRG
ncbi:hypothetical protein [Trichothermofontia sp.]